MNLLPTDPPHYLYDPVTSYVYVTDDFGDSVVVPSHFWYAPYFGNFE